MVAADDAIKPLVKHYTGRTERMDWATKCHWVYQDANGATVAGMAGWSLEQDAEQKARHNEYKAQA